MRKIFAVKGGVTPQPLHHARRLLLVLPAAILAVLPLAAAPANVAAFAVSAITITSPGAGGAVLPEMDEFATNVMGDPWDMQQPTDLAFYHGASNIANSSFAGGVYSGQMTVGDGRERITLLTAGAPNHTALRTGKTGYAYPINADHYRYLTLRMYKSNSQCNSGMIQWYAEDTYTDAVVGYSKSFFTPPLPCTNLGPGWYTYVLDLKTIGIQAGQRPWQGTIRELLIHPFAGTGVAGATVKLAWARLTAADPNAARPYSITWSGATSGVTLYASRKGRVLDGDAILIASNVSGSAGSYTFQTGVLPAGAYDIALVSGGATVWSPGQMVINAPPQVTILSPSHTSGQDYAATELGKAWDMNDVTDANYNLGTNITCVSDGSFSGGIYSGTGNACPGTTGADPRIYLGHMQRNIGAVDPPIDTNKYRYLSYRVYEEGQQDVQLGWITRIGWWEANNSGGFIEPPLMSRDIIILEGWNTYTIDLWANDLIDETYANPNPPSWQQAHPNRLRLDPDEMQGPLIPSHFHLDWVKLTAMDQVAAGQIYQIAYTTASARPVNVSFYYQTGSQPLVGATLIGSVDGTSVAPASGPVNLPSATLRYRAYLPAAAKLAWSANTPTFQWNTAGVAPGNYYICLQINDGYNSSAQCSQAPVAVR